MAPPDESSSKRSGPWLPPLVSGPEEPNPPPGPSTNSLDEIMTEAEANLKMGIAAKAALSPIPSVATQQDGDGVNLYEGDIVTLNPKLLNAPLTMPGSFPCFDASGESPDYENVEDPLIASGLPLASTISDGVTTELPFVFPTIPPLCLLAFPLLGAVSLLQIFHRKTLLLVLLKCHLLEMTM